MNRINEGLTSAGTYIHKYKLAIREVMYSGFRDKVSVASHVFKMVIVLISL